MTQIRLRLPKVGLLEGCRTPFQRADTGFRDLMSYQLAAAAIRGVLDRAELSGEEVDRVILGATVSNPRTTNVAREAALQAGVPASVPAVTVTAAGASATAAISWGVDLIRTGQAELVVAGGTDCVSDPPIGFRRPMRQKLLRARRLKGVWAVLRFLLSLRPRDMLPEIPRVAEFTTGETMGAYTERLAQQLGITRADQEAYALRSHQLAAAACEYLAEEIVEVQGSKGALIRKDNGIRPDTDLERLAALKSVFSEAGTITAGTSSFLTDGAAVVLLASRDWARRFGRGLRALIRGHATVGLDVRQDLLLGPAFAVPRALEVAEIGLAEVDVIEIHEAFAAQVLAVLRLMSSERFGRERLGLSGAVGVIEPSKLNAWGGSLALGNPFAPNGARLMATAAHRLEVEKGRWAVVATCAGGGLGEAFVLERPETLEDTHF